VQCLLDVLVTKANGYKQPFDRNKVVQTCLRMGASPQVADKVAGMVERRLYAGISTREILQLTFRFMRKYKPTVKHLLDLRKGLSMMEPKPEFETYIRALLANSGYEVESNRILRGKCGEHEVDSIAKKDGVTYFVEVKHHYSYHTLTGLDESRIAQAILEDANDGYLLGMSTLKIDRAMIVTNTRYSDHAIQYGSCKNILQVGWSSPHTLGLRDMVQNSALYPLSCLRGIKYETRMRLVNSGIVLVKQLLDADGSELARKAGLPREVAFEIIGRAQASVNTL
jgi:Holliday junction resolvase-like predicted endonuclease